MENFPTDENQQPNWVELVPGDMGVLPNRFTDPRYLEDEHFQFLADRRYLGTSLTEGFRHIAYGQPAVAREVKVTSGVPSANRASTQEPPHSPTEIVDKSDFVKRNLLAMALTEEVVAVDKLSLHMAAVFASKNLTNAAYDCLASIKNAKLKTESLSILNIAANDLRTQDAYSVLAEYTDEVELLNDARAYHEKHTSVDLRILKHAVSQIYLYSPIGEDTSAHIVKIEKQLTNEKAWDSMPLTDRISASSINSFFEDAIGFATVDNEDKDLLSLLQLVTAYMHDQSAIYPNAKIWGMLHTNLFLGYAVSGLDDRGAMGKHLAYIADKRPALGYLYARARSTLSEEAATTLIFEIIPNKNMAYNITTSIDPKNPYAYRAFGRKVPRPSHNGSDAFVTHAGGVTIPIKINRPLD